MKIDKLKNLPKEELKKLSKSELMEALEEYAEQEHNISFDDSKIKI